MDRPTFEIHQDETGKYRYRVRASNNKIITIGEGCDTRNDCMNGIIDVKETIEKYHDSKIKDFTKGETILILDKPKNSVTIGSTITFSGRLFGDLSGEGIEKAKISIYYNLNTGINEDFICMSCNKPTTKIGLCSKSHVVCKKCLKMCTKC